jgi:hypothetical protein
MGDLKTKLHGLDRLNAPDLWDRGTSIDPVGPDPDAAERPRGRRLTAAVVAIALFVAAGAFAWTAFRPDHTPGVIPVSPGPVDGAVLWPERTGSDLQAVQSQVDGGDTSVAWRLDPKEVAIRFAEQVMGWGSPEGRYVAAKMPGDFPPGMVEYSLERYAIPCPSPAPGTSSTSSDCPPPFEGESIVLQQKATLGDGGIWSVTQVQATHITLQVEAGEQVTEGSRIQGAINVAPADRPTTANAGVQIGTEGHCFIGTSQPEADDFSMPAQFPEGESCGSQPAYAWAATEPPGQLVGLTVPDPFLSAADKPRLLYGLTAIPFTVVTSPSTPDSSVPSNNYVFSDFEVGPSTDHSGNVVPGSADVTVTQRWSTYAFPGEHQCNITVLDASGRQIGTSDFQLMNMPSSVRSPMPVDVNGAIEGASATGSCDPARLDAPVAYATTVMGFTPNARGIEVEYRVTQPPIVAPWQEISGQACTVAAWDNAGVVARGHFTLSVPNGIYRTGIDMDPGATHQVAKATVTCEPFAHEGTFPDPSDTSS